MLWEGGGRCCESAEEEKTPAGRERECSVNHQWINEVKAASAGPVCVVVCMCGEGNVKTEEVP